MDKALLFVSTVSCDFMGRAKLQLRLKSFRNLELKGKKKVCFHTSFFSYFSQISTIVLFSPVKMEQLVSTPWTITLVIVLMATLERTAALVRIECVYS